MTEQFDTERQRITLSHKGKTYVYFVRELGYFEFQELRDLVQARAGESERERTARGMALMRAVTAAATELEDGSPAFDERTLKKLPKALAEPLSDAAMKAQGIDMDSIRRSAEAGEAADEGKA